MMRWTAAMAALLLMAAAALTLAPDRASAQQPPPAPTIFSGTATAGGAAVPAGMRITARLGSYESAPVRVKAGGIYTALTVTPPDASASGQPITFHLEGTIQANETSVYRSSSRPESKRDFTLNFPSLPEPTATPTPIPTATPVQALPAVFSGKIVVAGMPLPAEVTLVARIGGYETLPAVWTGTTIRTW